MIEPNKTSSIFFFLLDLACQPFHWATLPVIGGFNILNVWHNKEL